MGRSWARNVAGPLATLWAARALMRWASKTQLAGKTGLYVSLSCYYANAEPNTHVALLEPFGDFSVQSGGCHDTAHIVGQHPVLDTLTDESMSNWPCSVGASFTTGGAARAPLGRAGFAPSWGA